MRSANNNLNQISTLESGSVSLYYNGDKKFDTASGGVTITGEMNATSIASATTATTQSAGTNNTTIATTAFATTVAATEAANQAVAMAIALG